MGVNKMSDNKTNESGLRDIESAPKDGTAIEIQWKPIANRHVQKPIKWNDELAVFEIRTTGTGYCEKYLLEYAIGWRPIGTDEELAVSDMEQITIASQLESKRLADELAKVTGERDKLKAKYGEAVMDYDNAQGAANYALEQMRDADGKSAKLSDDLKLVKSHSELLVKERDELKEKLTWCDADAHHNYTALQHEIEELTKQRDELKAKLKKETQSGDFRGAVIDGYESLAREQNNFNSQVRKDNDALQREIEELKKERDELKERVEVVLKNIATKQDRLYDCERSNRKLLSELDEMTKERVINKYTASVDDILVHIGATFQHVYRVIACEYGGTGEGSIIRLNRFELERTNNEVTILPLMLESMVDAAIMKCVWTKGMGDED
jgi:SMC interacting uncharacterized protein involved in chromosome segregation